MSPPTSTLVRPTTAGSVPTERADVRLGLALAPGVAVLGLLVLLLVQGGASIPTLGAVLVAAILLALAVALRGPTECGTAALAFGVLTCTWNGVSIGGLQLGDLCFLTALLLLLPALVAHRSILSDLPAWLVGPAVVLVVVMLTHVVAPVSSVYLGSRTVLVDPYVQFGAAAPRVSGNVVNTGRWLVSVLAIPTLVILVVRLRALGMLTLVRLWVAGGAISAVVSLTDYVRVTAISAQLLPIVDIGGRQAGLSGHPNQLAVAAVITVPFAVWLSVGRRDRWALGALVLLIGAVLVTGSRGGAIAAPAGMIVTLGVMTALDRKTAVRAFWISYPVLLAPVLYLALAGRSLLSVSNRDGSTEGLSNSARVSTGSQAIEDWQYSPFRGVGLQVVAEAHNIYLQMLAAGGVVLLAAGLVIAAGSLIAAWRARFAERGLPIVIGISIVCWLGIGVVENQLTDRYLYVPISLLAALVALAPRAGRSHRPTPDPGGTHARAS